MPNHSPSHSQTVSERGVLVILVALVLFSASVSVLFFLNEGIRLDEAQSLWQTSQSPEEILKMLSDNVHVPGYHLTLHVWQSVLTPTVTTGRALSLLFFLLTIPALYKLGEYAYSRVTGLFAATLFAISPFMNWFGNEIRMYTLFALLTTLSHYFYLKLWHKQPAWVWLCYTAIAVVGIYTHYFFAFVLFAQAVYFFFNRQQFHSRALQTFGASALVVALLFLPWILFVFTGADGGVGSQPFLLSPTPVNLFNAFSHFFFGFQPDTINTLIVSLWPLIALAGFLALHEQRSASPVTTYLLIGFVLPVTIAFVVSILITPIFLSRYLVLAVMPIFLFVSWIVMNYPRTLSGIVQIALVLLMLTTLTVEAFHPQTPVRENFREAVADINREATERDMIVLSAPFTVYPFDYYYTGNSGVYTIPPWNRYRGEALPSFSEEDMDALMRQNAPWRDRVWLLVSFDQGYQDKVEHYFDNSFTQIDHRVYSPGLELYVYEVPDWYDDDRATEVATENNTGS
ncbi:MAG: glycosyltransferase family 39 protein [Candidatus Paceibacterota bacterium]